MGKQNRQRRAAKLRRRRPNGSQHSAPGGTSTSRDDSFVVTVGECFVAAAYAQRAGDDTSVDRAIDMLAAEPEHEVLGEIADLLEAQVARAWTSGWQPTDLARAVDRALAQLEGAVVRRVIAAESRSYAVLGARVAPAWMAQLERIGPLPSGDPDRSYLGQLPAARHEVLCAAVKLMGLFLYLPTLPLLGEPPSAWREGPAAAAGTLPDGLLARVRALLAKAESTTFDAEAEAFTAKAQELMAQHRVDRALLDTSATDRGEVPIGRRVAVDDPYADAKALLLASIADANGCRAVWSKTLGFTTVFGFADELNGVEELFTSLLVQATGALRREGSKQDRWGRSRTTRFRRSFLVAFAVRIGERLRATVDATVEAASAETGRAVVPMLAARDQEAAAAAEAAFPGAGSFVPSANDGEGWFAGTVFGDLADLSAHGELAERAR